MFLAHRIGFAGRLGTGRVWDGFVLPVWEGHRLAPGGQAGAERHTPSICNSLQSGLSGQADSLKAGRRKYRGGDPPTRSQTPGGPGEQAPHNTPDASPAQGHDVTHARTQKQTHLGEHEDGRSPARETGSSRAHRSLLDQRSTPWMWTRYTGAELDAFLGAAAVRHCGARSRHTAGTGGVQDPVAFTRIGGKAQPRFGAPRAKSPANLAQKNGAGLFCLSADENSGGTGNEAPAFNAFYCTRHAGRHASQCEQVARKALFYLDIWAGVAPRHYPGWRRAVTRPAPLWGNLATPTGAFQVPGCAPRGSAAHTETEPAGERSPGGHSPTE